ncbi:MAG: peptide/nickel transport system permease protein [Nocardioidaceae bacterium]|jgi:peptide/nickel transport system permease protein|nr:peptide/nickel transport system permease protein [Nocardioidaceae bacterium]
MLEYTARRIAQAIAVLWAAYTVTFVVLYALPSDPVSILLNEAGGTGRPSADQVAKLQQAYGFDDPIVVQYWHHLVDAFQLDFGQSVSRGQSVTSLLTENLPPTIALTAVALVLTTVIGGGLAFLATYVGWRPLRSFLHRLPAVGVSFPTFWVGLLLIQLFSFSLGWFPATGSDGVSSLVLPALTMSLPTSGILAQVLIRGLDDTLDQAHIATARAKGLSRLTIHTKHALKNASLPALTILGVLVGATVTNAVVAETVFSRLGIGRLAQQAVLAQDIPLVQGIVVLAASVFVVVNLVVDLIYPLLDPRVLQHTSSRSLAPLEVAA